MIRSRMIKWLKEKKGQSIRRSLTEVLDLQKMQWFCNYTFTKSSLIVRLHNNTADYPRKPESNKLQVCRCIVLLPDIKRNITQE